MRALVLFLLAMSVAPQVSSADMLSRNNCSYNPAEVIQCQPSLSKRAERRFDRLSIIGNFGLLSHEENGVRKPVIGTWVEDGRIRLKLDDFSYNDGKPEGKLILELRF
jgi:hypothetical protein